MHLCTLLLSGDYELNILNVFNKLNDVGIYIYLFFQHQYCFLDQLNQILWTVRGGHSFSF